MFQTIQSDRWPVLLRRVLLVAAIAPALAGCRHTPQQTMSGLWDAVPQVRWNGYRSEPPIPEAPAEPSVVANVAKAEPTPMVTAQETSAPAVTARPAEPPRSAPEAASPFQQPTEPPESAPAMAAAVEPTPAREASSDELDRLKAALQDDVQRAKSPAAQPGGSHDVRVRVESMLAKSRRLFDLGQLREARHTAKIAQDLGDSAKLDYSPEEERPVDLVQRIDDQLRAAGERLTPSLAGKPADPVGDLGDPELPDETVHIALNESTTGTARLGQDRRAKTLNRDPDSIVDVPAIELELDSAGATFDDAVVKANRSLTLTTPTEVPAEPVRRSVIDESSPIAFAPLQRSPRETEVLDEPEASVPVIPLDADEPVTIPRDWPTQTDAAPQPLLDQVTPPPVDHEESRPVQFQSVGRVTEPQTRLATPEATRGSISQTIAIVTLVICSALAAFWYRRGAT